MSDQEFIALVTQMREAQRSYFRDRSPQWLSKSKELERRVDKAIQEFGDKQRRLFE